MIDNNIYLDHNATSPLLPAVQTAINEAAEKSLGNPSSPHWAGREAKILLEEARNSLAKSLGTEPREIIFTSGGSESNNAVLRQLSTASGKIKFDLNTSGVDFASVTSHKLGGPRGIGLLYARQGAAFESLITGGKQERVRRAGTENVTLAVGFAKALEWYLENQDRLQTQYSHFREKVLGRINTIDGFFLNTNLDHSLQHTFNFGFSGISAESILISLDLDGVAVSTGSACSSGAMEASHVLLAMRRSRAEAKSSLRVSWGWSTTADEIDYFLERLTHHIQRLQQKQAN